MIANCLFLHVCLEKTQKSDTLLIMHSNSHITKQKPQKLVYHKSETSSGVLLLYIIILKSIKQI